MMTEIPRNETPDSEVRSIGQEPPKPAESAQANVESAESANPEPRRQRRMPKRLMLQNLDDSLECAVGGRSSTGATLLALVFVPAAFILVARGAPVTVSAVAPSTVRKIDPAHGELTPARVPGFVTA